RLRRPSKHRRRACHSGLTCWSKRLGTRTTRTSSRVSTSEIRPFHGPSTTSGGGGRGAAARRRTIPFEAAGEAHGRMPEGKSDERGHSSQDKAHSKPNMLLDLSLFPQIGCVPPRSPRGLARDEAWGKHGP